MYSTNSTHNIFFVLTAFYRHTKNTGSIDRGCRLYESVVKSVFVVIFLRTIKNHAQIKRERWNDGNNGLLREIDNKTCQYGRT